MAQSIKFNDDIYVDAEGVYDRTLTATQKALNENTFRYIIAPPGSDMNNYKGIGIYSGYALLNSPAASNNYTIWINIPMDNNNAYTIQFAFVYGANSLYMRQQIANVWGTWKSITLS